MNPFNDIRGQETAKKILLRSFNRDRLASTYLFYGENGTGKWKTAIAITALVNCEKPLSDSDGKIIDACGQCYNCRQTLNLNFPEIYFAVPLSPHKNDTEAIDLTNEYLDEKRTEPYRIITSTRQQTIPVNTAREIKRRTAIKPPEGVRRFIIFYQMERMLAASADSLLKLIEEPPRDTIIILTAEDPENLLPTIQSRAQKIRFRPIEKSVIAEYLVEKYGVSEKKADFAARISSGSIGRAVNLIADDTQASVRQESFMMFKGLFLKDNPSAVAVVNEFINPNNRGEVETILSFWQSFLSDLIIIKFAGNLSEVINIDLAVEMEKIAGYLPGAGTMANLSDKIKELLFSLRRNVHIRPAISALVLDLRKYLNQSA